MEQLDHNLLFRWFVGMTPDEPVWNASTFSKNRDRLMAGDIARKFFDQILEEACRQHLLSNEHFTVDGTLIEAWASQKSFKPRSAKGGPPSSRGRNAEVSFHGQIRKNDTHASTTDPEVRLFRKSSRTAAILCSMGPVLMENRNGLVVDGRVSLASGTAEREEALAMITSIPGGSPATLGADKAYDTAEFIQNLRVRSVTPHVAQNVSGRESAIDERTTRHSGYEVSQRLRKRVEEVFGWMKTVGGLRKTRHRGQEKVGWVYLFTLAAYDLARIERLMREPG